MADLESGVTRYIEDSINMATPEKLTLMLYEAALKNVRECRITLANNPIDGLQQSQLSRDILSALADNVNLSHPQGTLMRNLYLFCWRQVLQATAENRPDDLETVEEVLINLIEGLQHYNAKGVQSVQREDAASSINFAG
ncbi:flagellar export chaperone FliS [Sulfobacillus harzensis]|uniref:Flagellar protein FliS n=1 Tax=Sulfobacillus harzensis TaxID=2729629 RepID=A0A7Y0L1H9_9FIRM|nr:flagellar export chaperone FliS [Sulfobacillus harzensis]NMP21343.1 flagellar protein FliS [Sulfobacillus harzensis]